MIWILLNIVYFIVIINEMGAYYNMYQKNRWKQMGKFPFRSMGIPCHARNFAEEKQEGSNWGMGISVWR